MKRPVRIAPSLLSADFGRLAEEVRNVVAGGADLIHVDVMDGRFVPNITLGPVVVEAVSRATKLPLDVHLMIEEPERWVDEYARAGADILYVHPEACAHLHRLLQQIRAAGKQPAVAINPSTPLSSLEWVLEDITAVLVMSAKKAAALGLKPLARIAAFGTSGLDPATMGMGPVPASRKALQRAGWNAADVDLFELNEAFAAQACAVNKELAIDPAKVNVNGGAIAIGHPIGASGCRILVTLLHEMQRRDAKKGLAALCIGGGMGVSLALER